MTNITAYRNLNGRHDVKNPDDVNPYQSPLSSSIRSGENDDKIVVLASFDSSSEAHLFRNELVNNGIDARLSNEETMALGVTSGGTGITLEVLVLESQADRALVIKQKWNSKMDSDSTSAIAQWNCECGETVDAGFAVCWNCEAEHGKLRTE